MTTCPPPPRVVVIGGGIVGCSTAYHLGAMGVDEVLLLERHQLSSGSTWHAAGLVGQLRTNANVTQLLGYSVALYDRLEAETGLATGWKTQRRPPPRLHPRPLDRGEAPGDHRALLRPRDAAPDAAGGAGPLAADDRWTTSSAPRSCPPTARPPRPTSSRRSPAARAQQGVAIREDVRVTGIRIEDGRVTGVETDRGPHRLREGRPLRRPVVARSSAAMAGVNVPLVSVQHQYLITERIDGVTPGLPTLRDPDRLTYYKEEVGGLVMGGYEPNPKPWAEKGIPEDFAFQLLDTDWDHFEPIMELALGRVPALENAGIKQFINGPESFTPDGNFILGEAPEVRRLLRRRRLQRLRHRVAAAAPAWRSPNGWRKASRPTTSGRSTSAASAATTSRRPWVRTRTLEAYAKHYTMAWPSEEYASGRPLRRSPLYDRLAAKGAVFGEKLGWERPNWFAGPGDERPRHLLHRTAELVRGGRPRAPRLPRGGRALRPDLLRQVPADRPRRRGGARPGSAPATSPARRAPSPTPRC